MNEADLVTFLSSAFQRFAGLYAVKTIGPKGEAILITYECLWAEACSLADRIQSEVGRRQGIGILGQRSVESYTALLATWLSGNYAVPLQSSFPAERISRVLAASKATLVLVDSAGRAPVVKAIKSSHDNFVFLPLRPSHSFSASPNPRSQEDICYVISTSGSTGDPKLIPIRDKNILSYLRLNPVAAAYTPEALCSQIFDLSFDPAIGEILQALGSGACLCPILDEERWNLPVYFARNRINIWYSVPSLVKIAQELGAIHELGSSNLRNSFFIGEKLHTAVAALWKSRFPETRIWNLYGPAECTVAISAHEWRGEMKNSVVPIGIIHQEHKVHLRTDAEVNRGELCLAGPQVFDGYAPPQENERYFIETEEGIFYRTGDLVEKIEGGDLRFVGRTDWQMKIAGQRFDPDEIEAALKPVATTKEVVVFPGAPDHLGASFETIAVWEGVCTPQEIEEAKQRCRATIPEIFVPKVFFWVKQMPRNTNGKVDRKNLLEQIRHGALASVV